jgi:hypothetical protein
VPRIFISYRKADRNFAAMVLDEHLCRRFGSDQVFRATRSIQLGDDFRPAIWDTLRSCSALVAVVDEDWVGHRADGSRRIDDPADYVRREVAEALRLGIRVIPVLVADAPWLDAADLPDVLAELPNRQFLRLYARDSGYDLKPLLDQLAELLGVGPAGPAPAEPPSGAGHVFHQGGVVVSGGARIVGDVAGRDILHIGQRDEAAR